MGDKIAGRRAIAVTELRQQYLADIEGGWLLTRRKITERDHIDLGSRPGLMILTGWRRDEVLGLRWSEVDLSRRTARLADTKTGASLRPLSEAACAGTSAQPRNCDVVFASRLGESVVGYRKMWLMIAKLGDLPLRHHATRTAPQLRQSHMADLGYNEVTIASLLGHKTHSITSRYIHSADAVLLAATDAVANATMKLMASGQPQPQLLVSVDMDQSCRTESPL